MSKNASVAEIGQSITLDQLDKKYQDDVQAKIDDWCDYPGDGSIRAILQHNLIRTRAVLFQDCMTYRRMGFSADQGQMLLHVEQYMQAARTYKLFNEANNAQIQAINTMLDNALVEFAARRATIEEYETLNGIVLDPSRKENLEMAKKEMSAFYTKNFIKLPSFIPGKLKAFETKFHLQWYFKNFFSRLKMAIFGAVTLLAPMLIMTLHPTKLTVLVTTTVFVLVVATILAASMVTADSKDIVGATAAYTAVLVVFVGTANSGENLGDGVIGGIVVGSVGAVALLIVVSSVLLIIRYMLRLEKEEHEESQESQSK